MEVELASRKIPFEAQKPLVICYKKQPLKKQYQPDFICYDQLIIEIKATDKLTGKDESQLLNYLKATEMKVGLLINFGSLGKLEWERYANTKSEKTARPR